MRAPLTDALRTAETGQQQCATRTSFGLARVALVPLEPKAETKSELAPSQVELLSREVAGEFGGNPVAAELAEEIPTLPGVDSLAEPVLRSDAGLEAGNETAVMEGAR